MTAIQGLSSKWHLVLVVALVAMIAAALLLGIADPAYAGARVP